jgi:hypothetical protein
LPELTKGLRVEVDLTDNFAKSPTTSLQIANLLEW